MNHTRILLTATVLFLCFLAAPYAAPGPYDRDSLIRAQHNTPLQVLIDRANSGDTIEVEAGTYNGDLVLSKTIHLKGRGWPVIHGSGKTSVITVTADKCSIEGFVIEHSGSDLQEEQSGVLLRSNHNRIQGNRLQDILYGIYMLHSANNVVKNNSIHGRPELESGERGAGLHLYSSPGNVLEGNTIVQMRDGMYIQNSNDNRIRGNQVSDLRYGVHYMFSDANTFEDNTFQNNVAGAAIMYSRNIEFRRNAFLHNRGFSSFGILFQECDHCIAEQNFIIDNVTGIFMEALRHSTIQSNVIAENDVAIEMFSSADDVTFTSNNFIQNISPLQLVGRGALTRWSVAGKGNYWSDYDGYDLNSDAIGDVPQKIQNVFEFMEGNFPRLRLYLYSPAAQALAAAEKTFPILQSSGEVDQFPMMKPNSIQIPLIKEQKEQHSSIALIAASLAGSVSALFVLLRGQKS